MLNSQEICFQWLEDKKSTIKPLSYDKYETAVKNYLLSFFETHPIDALNHNMIEDYLNHQIEQGLSLSTAKFLKSVTKSIYLYAENIYHLNHIDFTCIKMNQKPVKKSTTLNTEQENMVFNYCLVHKDALSVAILLSLYSGLKISEICALQYGDVHFDKQYIDICKMTQRSINRDDSPTKTKFTVVKLTGVSKRQVALSDFMCDYLRDFMDEYNEDKYLLNGLYRLSEQRSYQNKLKKLSKQYGFDISFLILRNTFKENCIKNNVDAKTIMSMLGVTNIVITNNGDNVDYFNNQRQVEKLLPKIHV